MGRTIEFDVGAEARRGLPGKILKNLVQFIATVLIARLLGAEDLGTYSFLFTIVKAATIFTNGVGEAFKKRVSEADTNDAEYIGAALIFHVIFIIGTMIPAVILIHYFPQYIPVETTTAYIVLVGFQAYGLLDISKHLYAAIGQPANSIWLDPLSRSLILALQVVVLWSGYGLIALLVAVFIGSLVTAVIGFILVGTFPAIPSWMVAERIGSFAKWSVPGEFLGTAYGYSDTIAIYLLVGPAALGYFSAAADIVLLGTVVGPALAQPIIVKTSNNKSINRSIDAPLKTGMSFAGIIGLPILAIAIAIPELMPIIYGAEFEGTASFLILIAAYSTFSVYKSQFSAAFNGIDQPRIPTIVRLIQLVFYLPVIYLAATQYGLLGALLGSFLIEVLGFVLLFSFARKEFNDFVDREIILAQVVASIAVIVTTFVAFTLSPGGLVSVIFAVMVATVTYIGVTAKFSPSLKRMYRVFIMGIIRYVRVRDYPDD